MCGDKGVGEEGFGFGELQVSGGVVGLAGAGVDGAGDGDASPVEDFDASVFEGDGDQGSPAGVDADADSGAVHGVGKDNAGAQRARRKGDHEELVV